MRFFLTAFIFLGIHQLTLCQDSLLIIQSVDYAGNQITKRSILEREVLLHEGVVYTQSEFDALLARSVGNLKNLNLFNFVEPEIIKTADTVRVTIKVVERWYTWPSPIFQFVDPNFNTWYQTKDFSRTSYGVSVVRYNFRGRNEKLRINLRFGYNKDLHIAYEKPFFESNRNLGISFYANYRQNYQVTYGTGDNLREFYTQESGSAQEISSVATRILYRPATITKHYFGAQFTQFLLNDSLFTIAPDYLNTGSRKSNFVSINYQSIFDKRDYNAYTEKGRYHNSEIVLPAVNRFGNDGLNLAQLYHTTRLYTPLKGAFFGSTSLTLKKSLYSKYPYYYQRGLGYNDYVRGYEYFVIDGQDYALSRNTVKLRLFQIDKNFGRFRDNPSFFRIFLRSYLTVFFDAGYVRDRLYLSNSLANKWLYGYGVGLDFLSVYDIVIRAEVARNGLNQTGFFLHFKQSI